MKGILSLPTKGILGEKGFILTMGSLLIHVEQGPVNNRGAGYYDEPPPKKYFIKTTIQYEGKIYTDIQYTNKNIKVTARNLAVSFIDKKPVVKIDFIEEEEERSTPVAKIKFTEDE